MPLNYLCDIAGRPLAVARIFCIGRNYRAHMAELSSVAEEPCVVFMKPVTALVPAGAAVRLPRGRGAVHHEVELVVAVGRGGRDLTPGRALERVAGYALGLDLTLRDEQNALKAAGNPWEACKAFDQSAPLGAFVPAAALPDPGAVELVCRVNGRDRQHGWTRDMIHGVPSLLARIGALWELLPGDLIFTGTPAGVGPLRPGDVVEVASPQLGASSWRME